ncbi:hypothetical protein NDU88_004628 [Pleurodeles waltl]|uniref:Uncharacterized protein n=1 Tax=Pleurodeles waltl TaxID=8319 RepID=A0AAV7SJA8_PLEWA|nr:hypothetical protein NDU88_004628 [Pleurodeles waltl]
MGGHEEQSLSVRLWRPVVNQRRSVGVRAPSGHRIEERARTGEAHLTAGDAFSQVLQDVQQLVSEESSTSWGAGCAEHNLDVEEEVLDYDDGDEPEEGVIVQQRGEKEGFGDQSKSKGGRSFGVLQEATMRVVRSDVGMEEVGIPSRLETYLKERREGNVLEGERYPKLILLDDSRFVFVHQDGAHLKSRQLLSVLKSAIKDLGMDPQFYGTHSFKNGAATEAKQLGRSDMAVLD